MLEGDSYREVWAKRDFRLLWLGRSLAYLGQAVIYVAVALYVYELTGSAREISFAVALELLPHVLIGPIAGLLADRLERKTVLVVTYAVQAGLVALLPLASTLGQLYVLVFLGSLVAPVAGLVWVAALPSITGTKLFARGSSLNIVAINAVNVVGPLLGGWLVSLVGARSTMFVAVGCLAGATLLSLRAAIPNPPLESREPLSLRTAWFDLREGMRFLLERPLLRFLLLVDCVASLGWSAPDVAAIVYLSDSLGLGGREYGLLRGTGFLSIALGVYVLGRYARRLPRQYLVVGGVVVAGLAYALVIGQPGFVPLLVLWFISGLGWAGNWLAMDMLWAEATSDEVRGRVYSLAEAVIASFEVGLALLGGWLVNQWGPMRALLVMGVTISLGAIGVSALSRGYRAVADFTPDGGDLI